ncbi:MAG: hypothetical protein JXC32_18785 [Anaerolineae bacterium]|nr:hypothetical protein [Anaerolineae bacterium]
MSVPIKLLMTWDISPGREEACLAFVTQELPDRMRDAGLELTDAWFTAHGDWPQVRVGFMGTNLEMVQSYMASDGWTKLKQRLLAYTLNYREKVIIARGGFQI